ncbi:helix-turn-helix transcriptional regulator [Streptomyces coerulescens]|uniref:LuxR family transcriptional regulator n=1 Tax=Streptomyces coerulescens TaxID=29304 RepID=A0ABW0CNN3_STRCD
MGTRPRGGEPERGALRRRAGQPADDLEQALLKVRTLIESTVALHRDRSVEEQLITEVEGGYDVVLDTARRLIREATRTIDIVHARVSGTDGPTGAEPELIHGAAEPVSVRLLTVPVFLDASPDPEQFVRERPMAIRVAPVPPLQALLVDGARALVVAESPTGPRASLIRAPEFLHTLNSLYETVWGQAVPAQERIVFASPERAQLARQVLGALRAGVTDEVAARELTVSVRTYRRHVAEIMALLGANSRFQAGVRAAELGLLPPLPQGTDS